MAEHQQYHYGNETLGDLMSADAANAPELAPSVVGSQRRGNHIDTTMLRGGQGHEVTIPGSAPKNPFAAPQLPPAPYALTDAAPVTDSVPSEGIKDLIASDEATIAAKRAPAEFTPPPVGESSEAWKREEEAPQYDKVYEALRNGVVAIGRTVTSKAVAFGRKISFTGSRNKPQPEASIWEQAKQGPDVPTTPLGVVEKSAPTAEVRRRHLGRRSPAQQIGLDNSRQHDRGNGQPW